MTTIRILLTSFTVSKHIMHLCKVFLVNHNDMTIKITFEL